ncbi:putative fimbrial chaperone LpfB [Providencia manganoxydans]|uniref:fimbrial biogenesis chaperone n=2 Tax=Morganellaceae TaxID=1903414 RepID=UPI0024B1E313
MEIMQRKSPHWLISAGLLCWIGLNLPVSQADGGLSLSQTRVVFEGKAKSAKVALNNQSDRVYLINSRVLPTPDAVSQTGEIMPFMVTPPLFRLEKESRNTVLIAKNDTSKLPTDRESVFYLSFLAIPAVSNSTREVAADTDKSATTTQVSLGIRTVIKLFYRPSGLVMPAAAAPEKLTFSLQGTQLTVKNPTPYYVTLAQLTLDDNTVNVREQGPMLAPFSENTYTVKGGRANRIDWSVITDFGGVSELFHWSR